MQRIKNLTSRGTRSQTNNALIQLAAFTQRRHVTSVTRRRTTRQVRLRTIELFTFLKSVSTRFVLAS